MQKPAPILTREQRLAREAKARFELAMTTSLYMASKDLTADEARKLTRLSKDYHDARNQEAIRNLAKPFYRGDCRQIAAKLARKVPTMEAKHQRTYRDAVAKAESALFLPARMYADLKGLAALYKVRLPKLETVRAAPTTDTEPADRTSLSRFLPMPA